MLQRNMLAQWAFVAVAAASDLAGALLVIGYAFYLGLILIATPRQPPRWAPLVAFALVALTYGFAIVTLGRSGSREQLRALYAQAPPVSRAAVLTALFAAKDDDGLIRIASTETNVALRLRARQQLRLLATPRALKFLDEHP